MVTSGLASGRLSIQVGAIETRSLPSSLAAARRGFTFYLADPSARLTTIALGGSGEPPLPGKRRTLLFCCSGGHVACTPTSAVAAGTAASTGEILPDLELLAMNFYRRWRRDDLLLTGSIRNRFNHPLPVPTPILVKGQSRATAAPDLHLPVIIVGRNCEHKRERGCEHHAAQHSTQK